MLEFQANQILGGKGAHNKGRGRMETSMTKTEEKDGDGRRESWVKHVCGGGLRLMDSGRRLAN